MGNVKVSQLEKTLTTCTNDTYFYLAKKISGDTYESYKVKASVLKSYIFNPDITRATVTLDPTSYTYDGSEKKPTVTVKIGSRTLVKDTDYTVSYSNNINAGTATCTITGKGKYSGTKSINFTINQATIDSLTISPTSYSHSGTSGTSWGPDNPTPTVKSGTSTVPSSGYDVSYSNNSGSITSTTTVTATCTVTGKGNYTGTKSVNFTISLTKMENTRHSLSFSCSGVGSGSITKTIPTNATNISASGTVKYLTNYGNASKVNITVGGGSDQVGIYGGYSISADFSINSGIGTGSIKCKFANSDHPDFSMSMSGTIYYYTIDPVS